MTQNDLSKLNFLYVVNFYGTPPLNYFEKYVNENDIADLYVLKLPAVRTVKNKLVLEAFLQKPDGTREEFKVSIWFPFGPFLIYGLQYILNIFAFAVLMIKSPLKKFDIVFGETSFGGAVTYLIRKLGFARYSVYMNGDVLPEYKKRKAPFYFQGGSWVVRSIDGLYIRVQYLLRRLGIKNDLLWYPSKKVKKWDEEREYVAPDYLFAPAVTVDVAFVRENLKAQKNKNTLGYIGRLDESAGIDMSLEALVHLKKKIPDVKFLVVGGGTNSVERYKKLALDLGVSENVTFYGFVEDMQDAFDILKNTMFGMALYKPDESNVSLYTDVSKPKEYIKCGIPVFITKDGPDVATDLTRFNAGVTVAYDPEVIADTLYIALTNPDSYSQMQKGVLDFAQSCDYRQAFEKLLSSVRKKYHEI